MPTNEERREVAARLRGIVEKTWYTSWHELYTIKNACGCYDEQDSQDMVLKDRLADLIEPEQRTHLGVQAAWDDFGENVFNDDALDDFGRFKVVYQICQEIVEPLYFVCGIERTEQDEFAIYDHLSCGHVAIRQWPERTRFCPHCGAKVVDE